MSTDRWVSTDKGQERLPPGRQQPSERDRKGQGEKKHIVGNRTQYLGVQSRGSRPQGQLVGSTTWGVTSIMGKPCREGPEEGAE